MKRRVVAIMLSVAMCSLAACAKAPEPAVDVPAVEETTEPETEVTEAEPAETEEAVTETVEEAEPEAPAEEENAIPEGYQLVEMKNDVLGIGLTFVIPEEAKWSRLEFKDQSINPHNTRYLYRAYIDDSTWVTFSASLSVRSTGNLDWFIENNEELPNTEYIGYITGHSYEHDVPMNFYGDDYLDGKVYSCIEFDDRNDYLPAEEYTEILENLQKSVKFTVFDENMLYTDDGSLRNTRGLFAYPAEIAFEDGNAETYFKTDNDDVRIRAEFTDAEGQEVSVREGGYSNNSAWEKFLESNEKNSPYECEIAGFPAKGYIYQDFTSVVGKYTVMVDEETFYDIYVSFKGSLDATALKAMLEGVEDRDTYNKKMSAYADQFLSAATRLE